MSGQQKRIFRDGREFRWCPACNEHKHPDNFKGKMCQRCHSRTGGVLVSDTKSASIVMRHQSPPRRYCICGERTICECLL